MCRYWLSAVMVLVSGAFVRAQANLDNYLPSSSQVYFCWDGVDAHRAAFNKSALGKTLQGDSGKFLAAVLAFAEEQLKNNENEIGADVAAALRELKRGCASICANGFRAAIAVDGLLPPHLEAMFILPKAAGVKGELPVLLAKVSEKTGIAVIELKTAERLVHRLDLRPIEIGWWNEKGDLIITLTTSSLKNSVLRVVGSAAAGNGQVKNLPHHPLYKHTTSFDGFPVWARGYIDFEGLLQPVATLAPPARQLIDELGLKNLKSMMFQAGFDGPANRTIVEIDVPGPRKGILQLANQGKIKLSDLPPTPADASVIAASSLDVNRAVDVVSDSIEAVVKTIAPKEAPQVKTAMQIAEAFLGVALREDLVAPLGDMIMYYNSPTEIPLGLGGVYLVKVRDELVLRKTLARLINLTGGIPNVDIRVKDHKYRDAVIHSVIVNSEGAFQAPSFVIHKGWLAFSYYPQPVQGFVLRMNNELPAWKPNKNLEKTLSTLPAEFTAVSISDPRPTIKLLLSLAPVGVAAMNGVLANRTPNTHFDVGLIPNAHEATRHLFPNVTIVTDDGNKIRIETRASLLLPF